MAVKTIADRRALRTLEAKRDKLLESQKKARGDLVQVRAQIKHQRSKK